MKKINGDWPEAVRKMHNNETPFADIEVETDDKCYTVRMFWTGRGTYGRQVRTIVFIFDLARGESDIYTFLTRGCGYNKKQHALEEVVREFGMPDISAGGAFVSYDYELGGNCYRADFRKVRPKTALQYAAEKVRDNWESGDLAAAVRELSAALWDLEGKAVPRGTKE